MASPTEFFTGTALLTLGDGCGGSSNPPSGSPDGSRTVVSLTDAERAAFCADLASIEGGYSKKHELSCDGGTSSITFSIGTDATSCKTVFRGLPASCANLTVGQLKGCVTDTYALTCENAGTSVPSCDPFFACALG